MTLVVLELVVAANELTGPFVSATMALDVVPACVPLLDVAPASGVPCAAVCLEPAKATTHDVELVFCSESVGILAVVAAALVAPVIAPKLPTPR